LANWAMRPIGLNGEQLREEHQMTTISKVTSKGRITLPREIREGLDVQEGEDLALQEVAKGIVLLVKAPLSRTQVAERLLDSLVVSIGQEAIVKALRKRSFKERYGGRAV